ncbi:MAG: hypothetical protein V2I66_17205 [Halieaceae bacterium]|jgi:hypothetical protein|nr:hypothetical protein [Halieaceae bacterium]
MNSRILLLLAALATAGCANKAYITSTWMADDIQSHSDLEGVLVLTVTTHADIRQRFEREFTDALVQRGVRAVASYELNPAKKIDKAAVMAMATEAGTDTVLVTTYAGRDEHEVLHPGRTYYGVAPVYDPGSYGPGGYYRRGGVYGVPYEVAHVPDFYAQHKSLHLEANLYVVADGNHLWQAASGIEETGDREQMVSAFISAFVEQLRKDQLVR